MARRTIQARRASPYLLYLLIAFVILTLVFAVLFIFTLNRWGSEQVLVFGEGRIQDAKETDADLWMDLTSRYPELQDTNLVNVLDARDKLADEYQSEIHRLLEVLTAEPYQDQEERQLRLTVSEEIARTNRRLEEANNILMQSFRVAGGQGEKAGSVQAGLESLGGRITDLMGHITEDVQRLRALQDKLDARIEELKEVRAQYAEDINKQAAAHQAEKQRLEAARDSAIATVQSLQKTIQQLEDKHLAEQRDHRSEQEKFNLEVNSLNNQLAEVAEELKELKEPPKEADIDGKIIRVAEFGNVAYSDLGRKDGILLGLTFSIFGEETLGLPDAEPKAEARVVRIMDASSELRVYELERPVVAGDVLVNPIYDQGRRMSFRLVGRIDIDDDGRDDTERLKGLIQRYGGRVDDSLTVETDYLVTGEEPRVLPPPPAEATQPERDAYERARRAFLAYSEEMVKAQNYGIPILSLNRFLGLVGVSGRSG